MFVKKTFNLYCFKCFCWSQPYTSVWNYSRHQRRLEWSFNTTTHSKFRFFQHSSLKQLWVVKSQWQACAHTHTRIVGSKPIKTQPSIANTAMFIHLKNENHLKWSDGLFKQASKPYCCITGSDAHIVWEVYAYMSCHYCLILAHLLKGFLALYESF